MKFYIIATGWNCDKYVRPCYDSIVAQTYDNYEAVIVSDGSVDNTENELIKLPANDKIRTSVTYVNLGATYRRYQAIKRANLNDEDVIVFLGLDDRLMPNALERLKVEYDKGAWLTYGSWQNQRGKRQKIEYFRGSVLRDRRYRTTRFIATAPNTFKKFLINAITPADLKDEDGIWFTCCTDLAFMFPCLEQCPAKRIHPIADVIYIYNYRGSAKGRGHKIKPREILRKMPKKSILKWI